MRLGLFSVALFTASTTFAAVPANLVVENVPDFPPQLVEKVKPYLEARSASISDWNPVRPEMIIRTRFGETTQLHVVRMPGGARKQITFFSETVASAGFRPHDANTILLSRDTGGNEFFQFYRLDVPTGDTTLLTDGKSRNTGGAFSRDGKWFAYSSTKR